jgi:hypothetical protein
MASPMPDKGKQKEEDCENPHPFGPIRNAIPIDPLLLGDEQKQPPTSTPTITSKVVPKVAPKLPRQPNTSFNPRSGIGRSPQIPKFPIGGATSSGEIGELNETISQLQKDLREEKKERKDLSEEVKLRRREAALAKSASKKYEEETEKHKAETEKLKAETKQLKLETKHLKAEVEKHKAETKNLEAETENQKAEIEKHKAETETQKAEMTKLQEQLKTANEQGQQRNETTQAQNPSSNPKSNTLLPKDQSTTLKAETPQQVTISQKAFEYNGICRKKASELDKITRGLKTIITKAGYDQILILQDERPKSDHIELYLERSAEDLVAFKKEVAEFEQKNQDSQAAQEELREKVSKLQRKLKNKDREPVFGDSHNPTRAQLITDLAEKKDQVFQLEHDQRFHSSMINNLKNDLEKERSDLSDVRRAKKKLNDELVEANRIAEDRRKTILNHETTISNLNTTIASHVATIDNLEGQVREKVQCVEKLKAENGITAASLEQSKADLEKSILELGEKSNRINTLETQIEEHETKIRFQYDQLQKFKKDLPTAKEKSGSAKGGHKTIAEILSEQVDELPTLKNHIVPPAIRMTDTPHIVAETIPSPPRPVTPTLSTALMVVAETIPSPSNPVIQTLSTTLMFVAETIPSPHHPVTPTFSAGPINVAERPLTRRERLRNERPDWSEKQISNSRRGIKNKKKKKEQEDEVEPWTTRDTLKVAFISTILWVLVMSTWFFCNFLIENHLRQHITAVKMATSGALENLKLPVLDLAFRQTGDMKDIVNLSDPHSKDSNTMPECFVDYIVTVTIQDVSTSSFSESPKTREKESVSPVVVLALGVVVVGLVHICLMRYL